MIESTPGVCEPWALYLESQMKQKEVTNRCLKKKKKVPSPRATQQVQEKPGLHETRSHKTTKGA